MGSWQFRSLAAGGAVAVALLCAAAAWADAPVAQPAAPVRDLSAYKEESLPGGVLAGAAYLLLLGLVGGYAAWTANKVTALQAQVDALGAPGGADKP